MATFTVSLTIRDLKIINVARQGFTYYLKAYSLEDESEITVCKDLLQQEGVFQFSGDKTLTKL